MHFIENMAVQTLLLNQDTCTKNYNMYYKTGAQEWQMLPWALEESLGSAVDWDGNLPQITVSWNVSNGTTPCIVTGTTHK